MEKQGMPTVTFVSPPFRTLALRRRESLGLPDLAVVWVVHPMMNLNAAQIESLADNVLPDVIDALVDKPQVTA
jgi:hypothetical protein